MRPVVSAKSGFQPRIVAAATAPAGRPMAERNDPALQAWLRSCRATRQSGVIFHVVKATARVSLTIMPTQ